MFLQKLYMHILFINNKSQLKYTLLTAKEPNMGQLNPQFQFNQTLNQTAVLDSFERHKTK